MAAGEGIVATGAGPPPNRTSGRPASAGDLDTGQTAVWVAVPQRQTARLGSALEAPEAVVVG
jgi:hypothetical protein